MVNGKSNKNIRPWLKWGNYSKAFTFSIELEAISFIITLEMVFASLYRISPKMDILCPYL